MGNTKNSLDTKRYIIRTSITHPYFWLHLLQGRDNYLNKRILDLVDDEVRKQHLTI